MLNLVLIVVVFGVVMAGVSYAAVRFAARRSSEALMTQVVDGLVGDENAFYRSVERIFIMAEFWASNTWSGGFDTYELDKTFPPLLLAFSEASSLYVALGQGDLYMISRDEGEWVSWTVRPVAWGERAIVRTWSDANPLPNERWVKLDFNVTDLPWFKGALAKAKQVGNDAPLAERTFMAPPAIAPATGLPARAISMVTRTQLGDAMVFCFERSLAGVTRRMQGTHVLEDGKVAMLFGDPTVPPGLVYLGVPTSPALHSESAADALILKPVGELTGPIAEFVAAVVAGGGYEAGTPIRFASEGGSWWGLAKRLAISVFDLPTDPTWITAAVPESDLLRRQPDVALAVLAATVVALLLALFRALRLAASFSRPIDQLVEQSRRMERLDFERPTQVQTDVVEIGILARTVEGMRRALRSYAAVSEETRIAEAIMRAALPADLPRPPGFAIEALRRAADETGGEVFDVAPRDGPDGPGTALLLLDPDGFGIEAAVLSAQLRAVFRAAMRDGASPVEAAGQLGHCLSDDLRDVGLVRAWIAVLDPQRARLDFVAPGLGANAVRVDATGSASIIGSGDPPLGGAGAIGALTPLSVELAPGDVLLIVSNGVLDALDRGRHRFGHERLEATLRASQGTAAAGILADVDAAVTEFAASSALPSDRTMLLVKRL